MLVPTRTTISASSSLRTMKVCAFGGQRVYCDSSMSSQSPETAEIAEIAEITRLREDAQRENNWQRWGPYLTERQWGTVREDYSPDGDAWNYFTHDQARSRCYRWGEDGLLGFTDREC